ncbi:MAG TPA: tetratricopeptide repeat protein, partial [Myxococcaceae bacterium]|nr:tetratricopeptide repeat protein [Myxococcaceae bacterium]
MSRDRAIQLVEAGLWLRMSGDLDGARRLFEQALRLDPKCDRARELLGAQTATAEALPEELQHVPSSATNLFAVPLPRLFSEPVVDREEK